MNKDFNIPGRIWTGATTATTTLQTIMEQGFFTIEDLRNRLTEIIDNGVSPDRVVCVCIPHEPYVEVTKIMYETSDEDSGVMLLCVSEEDWASRRPGSSPGGATNKRSY